MTGQELKDYAVSRFGAEAWASALGKAIGKSRFQIWRYSKADHVPVTISLAVSALPRRKRTQPPSSPAI